MGHVTGCSNKKLLFVLKDYFDGSAQNALCVKGIIERLEGRYSIDILSFEKRLAKKIENVTSFVVKTPKRIRSLSKIFTYPVDGAVEKGFRKELQRLMQNCKYDTIVAVENPFEAVTAVSSLKKKYNFKFIIYEIDPASNRFKNPSSLIEKFYRKMAIKKEKKCFFVADYIVHMESHKRHFEELYHDKFLNKTIYLDIPAIDKKYWSVKKEYDNQKPSITLLYCGAFYKRMREPDKPLSMIADAISDEHCICKIYTTGYYLEEIKRRFGNKNNFLISDYISNDLIIEEYRLSDFLISVGNYQSDFLPSKTIQYISTGRPIIHFYSEKNDSSLPYLRKYSSALLIDLNNDRETSIKMIKAFLKKKLPAIDFNSILKIFENNTFDYSADCFKELL